LFWNFQFKLGRDIGTYSLRVLDCGSTVVADIRPLAKLSNLQWLRLSNCRGIADVSPLASLKALKLLKIDNTRVSDLGPLAGLTALDHLDLSHTSVSDLRSLARLSRLERLNFEGAPGVDIAPLANLPALAFLDLSEARILDVAPEFWFKPSFLSLYLYRTQIPGIPAEVLSQQPLGNCQDSLRAHLRDLQAGAISVDDVKLMVLGNGRVGKTQLRRRLCNEDYDPTVTSTHGIEVRDAKLTGSDGAEKAKLHIWDFGGQDIYHGTHALFLRTRAIFLIVWTPQSEGGREHVHDGMVFRNEPLAYWLDMVRHLGGAGSPTIIVQTRCGGSRTRSARSRFPSVCSTIFRRIGSCITARLTTAGGRRLTRRYARPWTGCANRKVSLKSARAVQGQAAA
jgi:internalin A